MDYSFILWYNVARELGEYKSQTQYEPSRRHVTAVNEYKPKAKYEFTK